MRVYSRLIIQLFICLFICSFIFVKDYVRVFARCFIYKLLTLYTLYGLTSRIANQRGLGLSGTIHEEAHLGLS